MTKERPTVRPVTLGRLVEVTHLCEMESCPTDRIATELEISQRRARETILEALRIELIAATEPSSDDPTYTTTMTGQTFLGAVRSEQWAQVSSILRTHSPHYGAFLEALDTIAPAGLDEMLARLEEVEASTPYSYNQTVIEVVGDWAERLGAIQRNAFSGIYYCVERDDVSEEFPHVLLTTFDELEETAGINHRQRYVSIPRLREDVCQQLRCPRRTFDLALVDLVSENVGRLELAGAPIDSGAKDAALGIKDISLTDEGGLVSTSQSTDEVMAGVEQFGKEYYYLAVHDTDLTFDSGGAR